VTRRLDLAHTSDAIDLVHFLEQRGVESKLVPLHRGTQLEVVYDENAEQEVEEWLSNRHAELARR
jgi:hypothetical protein